MSGSEFAHIDWRGRPTRIEYQWISPELSDRPLLAFLHEGLGSVAMWKDFPQVVCDAVGLRGLVYSRPGYGGSIALIYASHFPSSVAGLIVMAPHIFVEEYGLASIRQARGAYTATDLRSRLAR